MKRLFIKGIQIICILPATVSGPFIMAAILAAMLDFSDKTYGFAEAILAVAIGISILSGVAASWAVIFSKMNFFVTNPSFKQLVQIGLAFGVVGGCSVLIWIAKYISADTRIPDKRTAILVWVAFCGPSIALVISQFVVLTRNGRSIKERESPPAKTMP